MISQRSGDNVAKMTQENWRKYQKRQIRGAMLNSFGIFEVLLGYERFFPEPSQTRIEENRRCCRDRTIQSPTLTMEKKFDSGLSSILVSKRLVDTPLEEFDCGTNFGIVIVSGSQQTWWGVHALSWGATFTENQCRTTYRAENKYVTTEKFDRGPRLWKVTLRSVYCIPRKILNIISYLTVDKQIMVTVIKSDNVNSKIGRIMLFANIAKNEGLFVTKISYPSTQIAVNTGTAAGNRRQRTESIPGQRTRYKCGIADWSTTTRRWWIRCWVKNNQICNRETCRKHRMACRVLLSRQPRSKSR